MRNLELYSVLVMTSLPVVRTPSLNQFTDGGGDACEGETDGKNLFNRTYIECVLILWLKGIAVNSV